MKRNLAATALVIASSLLGASSFAQDAAPTMKNTEATPPTPYTKSELSRAQVKAEARQALKDGTLPKTSEADAPTPTKPKSELTRAQVRAEYLKAKKEGTLPKNSEASAPTGSSYSK